MKVNLNPIAKITQVYLALLINVLVDFKYTSTSKCGFKLKICFLMKLKAQNRVLEKF